MELKECAQYIAWIGILFFIIGRLIPKKWLCYYKFPFRTFRFEEDGRIYKKLRVHDWQNKIPDMSKIFKKSMEPKKLRTGFMDHLPVMINETCVAEAVHLALCVAGLHCMAIWDGIGGVICTLLNTAGNLPFILAQRYNRPRLVGLYEKCSSVSQREESKKCEL